MSQEGTALTANQVRDFGFNPRTSLVAISEGGFVDRESCFLAGTPITMWPTDPNLKLGPDGIYDQAQVRAGLWTKPIEEVARRDLVVAYDACGNPASCKVDKPLYP